MSSGGSAHGLSQTPVEQKGRQHPGKVLVVTRRDQYLAGSYPFCADILPGIDADILQRRPERAPQRELAAALANLRTQYGATLYTALRAYHGDIGAVWDKVVGHHHNPKLLEAGVLLVDHE